MIARIGSGRTNLTNRSGLKRAVIAGFAAAAATLGAHAQSASSLETSKLNYADELTALFLGDFANADLHPETGAFSWLFPAYVTSYARNCHAYLPANRVEITKQECARESTPVNVYGNPVGATTCIEYRTVGTGLYAKPDRLAISERLQAIQAGKMLGDYFDRSGDMMSGTRQMTDLLLLANDDMVQLFQTNQCDSKAIVRLEENMARFATGETPLKLASGETLADVKAARTASAAPSKPADHARLIDDLIAENARAWMLNRYVRGRVSNVQIQRTDSQGRPSSVRADYVFSQLGTATRGSVTVSFQDGAPKCLYFFDAPSTCRVASPRIANAYARGEY